MLEIEPRQYQQGPAFKQRQQQQLLSKAQLISVLIAFVQDITLVSRTYILCNISFVDVTTTTTMSMMNTMLMMTTTKALQKYIVF